MCLVCLVQAIWGFEVLDRTSGSIAVSRLVSGLWGLGFLRLLLHVVSVVAVVLQSITVGQLPQVAEVVATPAIWLVYRHELSAGRAWFLYTVRIVTALIQLTLFETMYIQHVIDCMYVGLLFYACVDDRVAESLVRPAFSCTGCLVRSDTSPTMVHCSSWSIAVLNRQDSACWQAPQRPMLC